MTRSQLVQRAREFAVQAHGAQKYGDKPYSFHLDAVAGIVEPFGEQAQVIAYLHDVAEDTEVTLSDIEKEFGAFVSECVGVLTDEPGKNRAEKKQKTYLKMSQVQGEVELALVVKAADRLANMENTLSDNNKRLLKIYLEEFAAFHKAVYREGLCEDLFSRLQIVLSQFTSRSLA